MNPNCEHISGQTLSSFNSSGQNKLELILKKLKSSNIKLKYSTTLNNPESLELEESEIDFLNFFEDEILPHFLKDKELSFELNQTFIPLLEAMKNAHVHSNGYHSQFEITILNQMIIYSINDSGDYYKLKRNKKHWENKDLPNLKPYKSGNRNCGFSLGCQWMIKHSDYVYMDTETGTLHLGLLINSRYFKN